jgi:hypothetical protein
MWATGFGVPVATGSVEAVDGTGVGWMVLVGERLGVLVEISAETVGP